MKLSEAIRLGAMLSPRQAFTRLYDHGSGGTCALGAAAEAAGFLDKETGYYDGEKRAATALTLGPVWYPVLRSSVSCPADCHHKDIADRVIVHLNNDHLWTREQIADWVETIERAQEPKIETGNQTAMEPAFAIRSEAQK